MLNLEIHSSNRRAASPIVLGTIDIGRHFGGVKKPALVNWTVIFMPIGMKS